MLERVDPEIYLGEICGKHSEVSGRFSSLCVDVYFTPKGIADALIEKKRPQTRVLNRYIEQLECEKCGEQARQIHDQTDEMLCLDCLRGARMHESDGEEEEEDDDEEEEEEKKGPKRKREEEEDEKEEDTPGSPKRQRTVTMTNDEDAATLEVSLSVTDPPPLTN